MQKNINTLHSPPEAKRREHVFKRYTNWTEQHLSRNKETELMFFIQER